MSQCWNCIQVVATSSQCCEQVDIHSSAELHAQRRVKTLARSSVQSTHTRKPEGESDTSNTPLLVNGVILKQIRVLRTAKRTTLTSTQASSVSNFVKRCDQHKVLLLPQVILELTTSYIHTTRDSGVYAVIHLLLKLEGTSFIQKGNPDELVFLLNGEHGPMGLTIPAATLDVQMLSTFDAANSKLVFALATSSMESSYQLELACSSMNDDTISLTPVLGNFEQLAAAFHKEKANSNQVGIHGGIIQGHLQFGNSVYRVEDRPFVAYSKYAFSGATFQEYHLQAVKQ
jgi:hypothetical protein